MAMNMSQKPSSKRRKSDSDYDESDNSDMETDGLDAEKQVEAAHKMSTDEICRRFLPLIPVVQKQLENVSKVVRGQRKTISKLRDEVKQLRSEVDYVKEENAKLRREVTGHNLIMSGVEENGDSTREKDTARVFQIIKNKLNMEPMTDFADRIGPKKDDKPRLLKIKFVTVREKDLVWKNKKKLGHPYYLSLDLTPEQRTNRRKLIDEAKKATEDKKKVKILWGKSGIQIDGSLFLLKDGGAC